MRKEYKSATTGWNRMERKIINDIQLTEMKLQMQERKNKRKIITYDMYE